MENLNQKQKEVVGLTEGPVLVIAGAGTGKTKALTHRILQIIKNGVSPDNILAITFTNKAAAEMKERIWKLMMEEKLESITSEKPFISTFHAMGVHILKENAHILKIPRHFNIFDKSDSKKAIRDALVSLGLDPKRHDPGKLSSMISKEKGKFVTIEEFEELSLDNHFQETLAQVWRKYESILWREKALDFDDLLLKTANLLKTNEGVRNHYQNLWRYIHIDEYQDTNEVQYVIAKLLAAKHKNVFVVGDVDQNIYSWRGANIKNILNFEKDYPEAKIVVLDINYRSTKTILKAANEIIVKNQFRIERDLSTDNPEGQKIIYFSGFNENHEADFIARKSKELIDSGVEAKEIAILYRANFQSRALEEAFLAQSLPYQILGTKFFERAEVKNILSYIKASLNPDSLTDMKRVINIPARGIGKVTLLKIFEGKEEELPVKMREKVRNFRSLLAKIRNKIEGSMPSEIIRFVIKETGMEDHLKKSSDEDVERIENMRELATLATKYDDLKGEEGLEKLLTESALASDQDSLIFGRQKTDEQNGVKLMTIHAAKGLEFDYCFITGLEDGLFPHRRIGESNLKDEDSEEERRLFYVALTRAKKGVFLTNAQSRTIFGQITRSLPSEFISDINEDLLEVATDDGNEGTWRKPLLVIDF